LITVERTLVAFTTILISAGVAHASHPQQKVVADGSVARDFEIVATRPDANGRSFARQVLPSDAATPAGTASDSARGSSQKAQTRLIYMNRSGVTLRPGLNNSSLQTSSIVESMTEITPWEIDDEDWEATMDCMRDMFSPFDVQITDRDPGMTTHLEAVFGGHPNDVGLPDNVAGISPFMTDCSVVESSVVFTFTDVLPDDPRLMCEVMAQEIAHSYGLDHQLLASDPMSYLDYDGDRVFQDEDAFCGEYDIRTCGIGGSVCRDTQNSVELLTQRLGRAGDTDGGSDGQGNTTSDNPIAVGCNAGQGAGATTGLLGLALLAVVRRRRRTSSDVARS
jgi:uncharacterized protein (TIGR03382 family)